MNFDPAPPEAALIRLAREAMGLTATAAAQAARDAGHKVGDTYWRDVERGQGGRRGERVTVRASDRTLAGMARTVRVTPEQLREAGRGDSAVILQEMLRREEPRRTGQFQVIRDPEGGLAAQRREAADKWAAMLTTPVGPELEEIKAAIDAAWPGATGAEVFPNVPVLAEIWDMAATPRQYRIFAMATWLHLQRNPEGLSANKAG